MAVWRAFLLVIMSLPVLIGMADAAPQFDQMTSNTTVFELAAVGHATCPDALCGCEEASCVVLGHCPICGAVLPRGIEPLTAKVIADQPAPTLFPLFEGRNTAPERVPPRLS